MAFLIVTSGPAEGMRIEVEKELVLGREHADVELDDPEISRQHARVRAVGDGLEVEDLGSSNGTKVDGERITGTVPLRDGATIKLGQTVLRVEARSSATILTADPGITPSQETVVGASDGPAWRERSAETEAGQAPQSAPPPRRAGARPAANAPVGEFGALRRPAARRRRGVASRLLLPTLLTYLAIAGTAAGLILYFAERT